MKATDLMIGDYVRQKYSGLLLRVRSIEPPYIKAFGEGGQFKEDTFDPIPLTYEILEASGFEYHEGEKNLYGVTTSPYYSIDGSPYIFCDGDPFAVWFEDEVTIKYVHELQHVLRLCIIEKEIKL